MSHTRYIFPMFLLTAIVGSMQYFATYAEPTTVLYIEGWFDKIQHSLAGTACGILGVWLTRLRSYDANLRTILVAAASSALIIGFGWEIFEHIYPEVNGGTHSYFSLDTHLDLVCDTLGGIVATYFFRTQDANPT